MRRSPVGDRSSPRRAGGVRVACRVGTAPRSRGRPGESPRQHVERNRTGAARSRDSVFAPHCSHAADGKWARQCL